MNAKPARSEAAQYAAMRLRQIRKGLGLSLGQVEERSKGRIPAAVIGSYERLNREPTLTRLAQVAAFYQVSVHDLILPDDAHPPTLAAEVLAAVGTASAELEDVRERLAAALTPVEVAS